MRKVIAFILAAVLLPSGLVIAATKKKTSSSKKSNSTAKKTSSTAKKTSSTAKKSTATAKKPATTAKKTSSKRSSSKKKTTSRSSSSWRTRQLQPTPERYRDIQQALIDKGYLEGEANGKIDSLSLIALGLGPKYDTAAVAAAPPPVPRLEP